MIYLASPYNHADPAVRERRFLSACRAAAQWMREGLIVYSAIVHNHPIAVHAGLPTGWDFWEKYDQFFVRLATEMRVLMLPDWEDSVGIAAEMKIALASRTAITYWRWQGDKVAWCSGEVYDGLKPLGGES